MPPLPATVAHQQPRHLTVAELLINFAVYGGVGYWLAGATGAACAAAVVSGLCLRSIWVAGRSSSQQVR